MYIQLKYAAQSPSRPSFGSSHNRESFEMPLITGGQDTGGALDQFRFEFLIISSGKWNIIIRNFWYIPKFSKICHQEFLFHLIFLPEFPEFSLEWFAFRNSTIFGFSGNRSRKFPCHLSPFRKFRNFWSNGKRPCFPFDFIVFAMLPAHGIWWETVSLLDVM